MGGKGSKSSRAKGNIMEDDEIKIEYQKYLKKNQIRTQKEFKKNSSNEKSEYTNIKKNLNNQSISHMPDDSSFSIKGDSKFNNNFLPGKTLRSYAS